MRLIDADAISQTLVRVAMIDYMKDEDKLAHQIEGAVVAFNTVLNKQPTVDQWHYPNKGEYPPKNKHLEEDGNVLCLFNNGSRDVAWYIKTKDREGWLTSCGLEPAKSVKCWQYIVPPKEEA